MPALSFLQLTEPVLVLNGGLLPPSADTDEVRVVVGPDAGLVYPPEARAVLEYFRTPRRLSDAHRAAPGLGMTPAEVEALAERGVLWRCEPGDAGRVGAQLGRVALRVQAPLHHGRTPEGSVGLDVGNGLVFYVSQVTVAVVRRAGDGPLGPAVAATASEAGVAEQEVWRFVAADAWGVLQNGAGFVAVVQD